ncbi:MAG: hypothetical protein MZV64_23295 [Ignavibacteriales bacterium]|nr:hypothetical protein [Ignavibacteriales bacterium]
MALYDMHHDVGKASADAALVNFGAASFEVLVEALDRPGDVDPHPLGGRGRSCRR